MSVEDDLSVLLDAGFVESPADHVETLQGWCDDAGMSSPHPTGIAAPYRVLHVLNRGDVWARIEQNTGLERQPVYDPAAQRTVEGPADETMSVQPYPPVVIIETPKGRVAMNNPDRGLLLSLLNDLAGSAPDPEG